MSILRKHPLALRSMSKRLLPLIPAGLTVVQVLPSSDRVTIVARPLAQAAFCPDCGSPSQRLHSRYERRLFDLTTQGRPVSLQIQARRFRCLAPSRPRAHVRPSLSASSVWQAWRPGAPDGSVMCSAVSGSRSAAVPDPASPSAWPCR